MKRLPEQAAGGGVISDDVIAPMEAVKAYVSASHAYHRNETPELALVLLHARARVLRDEPLVSLLR